jgi:hypothetical protein
MFGTLAKLDWSKFSFEFPRSTTVQADNDHEIRDPDEELDTDLDSEDGSDVIRSTVTTRQSCSAIGTSSGVTLGRGDEIQSPQNFWSVCRVARDGCSVGSAHECL